MIDFEARPKEHDAGIEMFIYINLYSQLGYFETEVESEDRHTSPV